MKQVLCCRECGKRFWPKAEGQRRCYECIMASPPPEPSSSYGSKEDSTFVEWFIYRWNVIRAAAGVKGAETVPEAADKPKKQTKRKYQKKKNKVNVRRMALERGLEPNKVYMRLRRGWPLEKALEVEE